MKRSLYIITAIVLVLGAAAVLYLVFAPKPVPIPPGEGTQTTQVDIGPVSEIVGATGTVTSGQSARLNWKTSGLVAENYFQVGDQVQAGDILAELDPGSLSALDILAQANLVAAQRALEDLKESRVQRASAFQAVDLAQQALDEAKNPVVDQAAALQAIAEAEQAVADSERKLKIITSSASQNALDQAQANLVLAEKKLNDNQEMIDRIQKRLAKRDDQYKPWESRRRYKKILEALEFQHTQLQIAYENLHQRYENLQAPPDQNEVDLAKAELLDAQAQLFEAQKQWQRIQEGTSPADLALLEARLADAQREWERVKDGPSEEDIAAAQARVTAAQATLENSRIIAPFNGTITQVLSQPNDRVSPGMQAFRLDDLSSLWVDVGVSEIDINLVEVGQPVKLSFDAIPGKDYQGQVVEVSPVGSNSQGVVDFKVRVKLTDADEHVRPGMTAAVEIQTAKTLQVPNRVLTGKDPFYQLDQDGNLGLIEIAPDASSEHLSQVKRIGSPQEMA